MKTAFQGTPEGFTKLQRMLPELLAWHPEMRWDRVIVEDWSRLSTIERTKIETAIRHGQHLLAMVSAEFVVPGLDLRMRWLAPPVQVLDENVTAVNIEVLGAFDFVTSDEVRLAPGCIVHRASDQRIVTFEFWGASNAGKVIVSSLQLLHSSLYSDERQRKAIVEGLLQRLSVPKTRPSTIVDAVNKESSMDIDKWKRQLILDTLKQRKGLEVEKLSDVSASADEVREYCRRLEDAAFLAQEADRLLPYAFKRRLGI